MRVLVAGATGFIGRAVVPVLQRHGHTVVVWTRSEPRARGRLGADIETLDAARGDAPLGEALARCDAVINLAGSPILGGRWSARRWQNVRDSRVGTTDRLVQAMASARNRPRVLVSSGAIGYYGDRPGEILHEGSMHGADVLSRVCVEWEAAARRAERLGVRVVRLRIGVVLGRDGGALAKMLPPFRLGLGGPFGSGAQYVPWIHLHDLAHLIAATLEDGELDGAINAVAPEAMTARGLARALGRALRRPARVPLPSFALRAMFGEAAATLLGSRRVDPAVLRDRDFPFAFPTLDGALADVVAGTPVLVRPMAGAIDARGSEAEQRYLRARPPSFELRMSTIVNAPLDETFAFFAKAGNLGMLTPSAMRFTIRGPAPEVRGDAAIDYRLRVGPVPIAWRSRIASWVPRERFVDLQERGPYRCWWHEHSFRAEGASTVMEDRVCYAPPFGAAGRLVNRLFIIPSLQRIFQYRADVIRLRFGAAAAGPAALRA